LSFYINGLLRRNDRHDCCVFDGMSFLDMQDLATIAAQTDIGSLIGAWCGDADALFNALEAGFGACLAAFVVRRRVRR
jgi:hypothetical protein